MIYEPKWDGFRCLAFRDEHRIELQSRNENQLGRYFPELVEALRALPERSFVMDGEIIVTSEGEPDFSALLARLHPAASRVDRLRRETPACFVGFDALASGTTDLTKQPFTTRRELLAQILAEPPPPLRLTPATDDPDAATRWLHEGRGIDGVIVKRASMRYEPGKRSMTKVKLEQTLDCVVAGFRWHHSSATVGSLLLGLFDGGELRHVGLASSFRAAQRVEFLATVEPKITRLEGHPWERGFNLPGGPIGRLPGAASAWADDGQLTWVPLAPELVCEVAFEHLEKFRFRHPARFRRWRPDREPHSCTYEQIGLAMPPSLGG